MIKEIVQGAMNWWEQANANFKETEERLEVSESGIKDVNTKVSEIEENQQGLNDKVVELEERANPNLLINSNFKVSELVNQRGEGTYSSKQYSFMFDMWLILQNGETEYNLNEEFVRIKPISFNTLFGFRQAIENFEEFRARKYTVSFKAKSVSEIQNIRLTMRTDYDVSRDRQKDFILSDEMKVYTFSFELPSDINTSLELLIFGLNESVGFDIEYIKLELGEKSTPFIDDDPVTKLAKCQRYFVRYNYAGIAMGDNHRQLALPFYVNMRVNPIFKMLHNMYAHSLDGSKVQLVAEAGYTQIGSWNNYGTNPMAMLFMHDGVNPLINEIQNGAYHINRSGSLGNTCSDYVAVDISAEL